MDYPDLNRALAEFGFSKKESAVYLAITKLQHANAHQIAKDADVERTTVYEILEDLVKRGVVTKSVSGKRQSYLAEPPEQLQDVLRRQQAAIVAVLPALHALQGKQSRQPIIRFYTTIEAIKVALLATVQGREKLRRDFASVEHIVDFLGQRFIDREIEKRIQNGIRVRSLRTIPPRRGLTEKDWYLRSDDSKLLRDIRYLPKAVFEPAVFINDTTVTVISSKKESFALVIESSELSQAMKTLFDIAWATGKKLDAVALKIFQKGT